MEHNGFSFIEVFSQCPVQAGKNIWGEKDPAKIMEIYKKNTFLVKPEPEALKGNSIPEKCDGKYPIGVFINNPEAVEYLDKVEAKLIECGVR